LKVGGGASVRREVPEKFLVVPLHFFVYKGSSFDERFCDGQYSFVSFLFAVLILTVPPYPHIWKSGGHVPPVPYGVGATGRLEQSPTAHSSEMTCIVSSGALNSTHSLTAHSFRTYITKFQNTGSRHLFSHSYFTDYSNCFAEYEQRTLYGALAVTLAMLLCLINCCFIIIIIIIHRLLGYNKNTIKDTVKQYYCYY